VRRRDDVRTRLRRAVRGRFRDYTPVDLVEQVNGRRAVWHAMSYADRVAFMFIEQVPLELLGTIVVELPEQAV